MDFLQLEYFRALAQVGNMSQVAKEFFISQLGLSRSLTRLEKEIEVPLFERRRGRISLNVYGQVFLVKVNEALDCLEQGANTVRQLYSRDQNILSVACVIENFLPDFLRVFSPKNPEIRIRHTNCSIQEIENQLLRQNLELAICCHPTQNEKIRFEPLFSCPYVLICNPENRLAAKAKISLADAKNEQFICVKPYLERKELDAICRKCGFVPKITHEIENAFLMINLLKTNAGVVLIPFAYFVKVGTYFSEYNFKALALNDKLPPAILGVVYLSEQYLSASATLFLEFLRRKTAADQEENDTYIKQYFQGS